MPQKGGQTFGALSQAFLRIVDVSQERDLSLKGPLYEKTSYSGREFCGLATNNHDAATLADGVLFGTLWRREDEWEFQADKKEIFGGLTGQLNLYGKAEFTDLQLAMRVPQLQMGATGQELMLRVRENKLPLIGLLAMAAYCIAGPVPLIFVGIFYLLCKRQ
jgi:hypothetical protein